MIGTPSLTFRTEISIDDSARFDAIERSKSPVVSGSIRPSASISSTACEPKIVWKLLVVKYVLGSSDAEDRDHDDPGEHERPALEVARAERAAAPVVAAPPSPRAAAAASGPAAGAAPGSLLASISSQPPSSIPAA